MSGWASNSKYPLLGSLRAVAQTLSYEVRLAVIFLSVVALVSSYRLSGLLLPSGQWTIKRGLAVGLIWFISALAETRRTPFDFSEGESELVSGFNREYGASLFVLFFLAEYCRILFMGCLFTLLFTSPSSVYPLFGIKLLITLTLFLWVRRTLPRARYDKLIIIA
jgi:NADH-ubiquinone oxidoreductase chain 1